MDKQHRTAVIALALAGTVAVTTAFASPAAAAAASRPEKRCVEGYRPVKGLGRQACRVEDGLYKIKLRHGGVVYTHGPDVAGATASSGSSAEAGSTARKPACHTANTHGNYYHRAIVAYPYNITPDETASEMRSRIHVLNGIFHRAAVESGSPAGADLVFLCDSAGNVRVDMVKLPTHSSNADFDTVVSDMKKQYFNKTNEKYAIWYDAASKDGATGTGTLYYDDRDSESNYNNTGPDYAVAFNTSTTTLLHEIGHNNGAVQKTAPYATGYNSATGNGAHCWEGYDVMCYNDGGNRDPGYIDYNCTDFKHFDCRHNDYFDAQIGAGQGFGAGSYLDNHWNMGECYERFIMNYACSMQYVSGDFNGDGRKDLAGYSPASGTWTVAKSTGYSLATATAWSDGAPRVYERHVVGDFNGDRLSDVASFDTADGTWTVSISYGYAFSRTRWADYGTASGWTSQIAGDFNADGRDDVANFHPGNGTWWVSISTGAAFTTAKWADFGTASGWTSQIAGDFNADGRDDVANFHPANGTWWVSVSTGTAFTTTLWADFSTASGWGAQLAGDFNGDGRDDIANYHPANQTWWVSISAGTKFSTALWASLGGIDDDFRVQRLGDFDGDGRDDIVQFRPANAGVYVGRSTGSAFAGNAVLWATLSPSTGWTLQMDGDFTGDGLPDVARRNVSGASWYVGASTRSSFTVTRFGSF